MTPRVRIVAAAVMVALAAPPVAADITSDRERASVHFRRGVELYRASDVRAAQIEFRRAYEIAPDYRLLFNIAQTAAELRDYVGAHRNFVRYLRDGGAAIDKTRRQLVRREIARLSTYLAQVTITVSTPGARIDVDGVTVGRSPHDRPLLLGAGRRVIAVTKPGFARWEQPIDLAGEDERAIDVELISTRVEPVVARRRGGTSAFWISASATAALAVGTGITAALTESSRREHEDELARVPTTRRAIDASARKVRGFALATDVGIGLTVTAVVVTAVLGVRAFRSHPDERSVSIVVGERGLGVAGRF
jgi:hypothetical protein